MREETRGNDDLFVGSEFDNCSFPRRRMISPNHVIGEARFVYHSRMSRKTIAACSEAEWPVILGAASDVLQGAGSVLPRLGVLGLRFWLEVSARCGCEWCGSQFVFFSTLMQKYPNADTSRTTATLPLEPAVKIRPRTRLECNAARCQFSLLRFNNKNSTRSKIQGEGKKNLELVFWNEGWRPKIIESSSTLDASSTDRYTQYPDARTEST